MWIQNTFDQQHLASSPAAGILFTSVAVCQRASSGSSENIIFFLKELPLPIFPSVSPCYLFSVVLWPYWSACPFCWGDFQVGCLFCFCHPPSTRWDLCIQEQRLLPHSVEERWPAQLSTFSREERWWIRKLIFSFALWRPHFSFLLSCSLTDRQLLLQGFIFLRIVVWHFSKLLLSIGPFLSSTVYLLLLSYLRASPHVFHCLNYCRGIHSCIYILQNKNCIIKLIMETMIIDCRR